MVELEKMIDGYLAAWNERDADRRAELLAQAVTEDCVFVGPLGEARGRTALGAAITEAQDMAPDALVERVGPVEPGVPPDVPPGFRWRIRSQGSTLLQGTDVVECSDDGRLRRIAVSASRDP